MDSTLSPLPVVSICIITYRHAQFIRQCVESALAQKTDFPYEILVGEDESDDGTREICQELAAAHPDRIRLVLNRRVDVVYVDGRPRGTHNLVATVAVARGEFVALCEGDDYWTDPQKLAVQVAYLRRNADCVGCFHEASLVDHQGHEIQAEYFKPQVGATQEKYDRRDCIGHLLSKYATCSLLFRREAFRDPPAWYLRRSSDFFFDLVITAYGTLGFIDRRMAAYRRHSGGVWCGQPRVMQFLELITRFRLLLSEPTFFPAYREELMAQLTAFERAMALYDDVEAVQRELTAVRQNLAEERNRNQQLTQDRDQLASAARQLLTERDKLVKFVEKQQATIQSREKSPASRFAAPRKN
jgi:glycosyltransferase involved in cell wall biosynthesis